jgi:hypothetical protein
LCSPANAGAVARHRTTSHLMLVTVLEPREHLDKNDVRDEATGYRNALQPFTVIRFTTPSIA